MSQAPAVRKDVTLSSLYFPEADKQTSSTGQLWYTAWCPLLQVGRGEGWGREGRGGEGIREGGEVSLCVFMYICVSTDVKYMYEIRMVCGNGSC